MRRFERLQISLAPPSRTTSQATTGVFQAPTSVRTLLRTCHGVLQQALAILVEEALRRSSSPLHPRLPRRRLGKANYRSLNHKYHVPLLATERCHTKSSFMPVLFSVIWSGGRRGFISSRMNHGLQNHGSCLAYCESSAHEAYRRLLIPNIHV